MKRCIPFFLVFFVSSVGAQEITSVLEKDDIDKFISTYKPLAKDLEALGDSYEEIQNPTSAEAMQASAEVDAVFKKHGWTGDYLQKFSTIVGGTGYLAMIQQMDEMDESQKAMMKGYADQMKTLYAENISDEDLALLKPRYEEILEAMQD